ncbi:MAG TPA: XRE family transcriptional regulator, partial [Rhodospirillaceae bacterium]|nr:XRE family transcriptional regulator [Rhodospirillaceae bacterium]
FEQICHRLTTLSKPTDRGIPLHMLRVYLAGNISKRFTLSGLPIPRHGGACSRWNIYSAFLNPGQIQAQVSSLPDGTSYFCIARTIIKGGIGFGAQRNVLSIGMGCDVRYAKDIVYADALDLTHTDRFSGIGVACRICERMDCTQRAFPPVHLRYDIEENVRGPSPYTAPGWPHHHERPGGTR